MPPPTAKTSKAAKKSTPTPAADHVSTAPKRAVTYIPIDAITEDELNHRIPSKEDEKEIEAMLPSVRAQGILQPIEVYRDLSDPKRYHRTFGARRTEAARRCGLKEIPACVLGYTPTPAEREERRTIENFGRKDLNPAERALAVSRMVEARGSTPAAMQEVANVLSMKAREVQDNVYVVARLSPKARALLAANKISLGHARVIVKAKNHPDQEQLANEVAECAGTGDAVSINELEGMLQEMQRPLTGVLWRLNVAVGNKPPCIGCPSNTDSNTDLFGTKTGESRCTNAPCYDFKKNKTGEAARLSVEKIKDGVKKKRFEAAEAGAIDVVLAATPEYLEPAAVQALARSQIVLPAKTKQKGKAGNGPPPKPALDKKPTEKQLRQQAVLDWMMAFAKWRDKLGLDLGKETQSDPRLNLIAMWMEHSIVLGAVPTFNMSVTAKDAPEEKPVTPSLARLLDAAGEEKFDPLALAADMAGFHQVSLAGYGPELITRIADVFGVDMNDPLAQPPKVEDFLPKELHINVRLASGTVRPHAIRELRKATPDEIKDFENARKE